MTRRGRSCVSESGRRYPVVSRIPRIAALALALVVFAEAGVSRASEDASGRSPFTGPPPETGWSPVFHFGLAVRIDEGSPLYRRGSAYAISDLGALRHFGRHFAAGPGVYLGGDDYRLRFGPKLRVATWITRDISLEVAPGLLVAGDEDWGGEVDYPGAVGEVSIGIDRSILFTAEVEQVRISKNGVRDTDTSWYLGAKVGGVPGLVGLTAGFVVLLILHTSVSYSLM